MFGLNQLLVQDTYWLQLTEWVLPYKPANQIFTEIERRACGSTDLFVTLAKQASSKTIPLNFVFLQLKEFVSINSNKGC
jgi:hypothetical protein